MSEGEAKPPVVIVKPETKVTSGTDVQDKLISAARVFSDLLKPTFGPRGLDKMLYKTDGTTAVTNDGAKIVAELMVKHPAAKMMVSMGNSQEEACGDGVTTTMLLCGSLLQEASNLLRKGLHPLTLVDGYRSALAAATEQMDADTHDVSDERLAAVTETALRGKGAEAALDHFSHIITDALSILSTNRDDAGAEHVAMFKTGTGEMRDSKLIRGVVVNRRVLMDSLPNRLSDAKVAVLGGDLKIRSMTRDAEIQITSADQLDSFVDAEQARKRALADAVIASGAGVVLCTGEVDRDVLHHLADAE
ncbi:MAG: TCP-1/cpn60 chaperonin family protein, partial [Candidatus Thermoplasmatota archaeon]|nr:TCP-1/cpn60 chaperonin family protein [Candidatus Thermoplasmatota archaeon]